MMFDAKLQIAVNAGDGVQLTAKEAEVVNSWLMILRAIADQERENWTKGLAQVGLEKAGLEK